jgi:hypothetical protein
MHLPHACIAGESCKGSLTRFPGRFRSSRSTLAAMECAMLAGLGALQKAATQSSIDERQKGVFSRGSDSKEA